MKRLTGFLILMLILLPVLAGCSGDASQEELVAPASGVLVALEFDGKPSHPVYEVQFRYMDDSGFIVMTLEEGENYREVLGKTTLEDHEGETFRMTAYVSRGNQGPDLESPLSETREIRFENGQTSEGNIVRIKVSE